MEVAAQPEEDEGARADGDADDAAHGDVPGYAHDYQREDEGRDAAPREEHKEPADARRDALAAAEPEVDGPTVTGEGRQRGEGLEASALRGSEAGGVGDGAGGEDGDGALGDVEHQREPCRLGAGGAEDVAAADVAAAGLPDVNAAGPTADEQAPRDGALKVGRDADQHEYECRVHGARLWAPFRNSSRMGTRRMEKALRMVFSR